MIGIRPLTSDDIDAYIALRRRALEDAPLAFTASPDDDVALDPKRLREEILRGPDSMIFGAFDEQSHLVGAVGLVRGSHLKNRHKMTLWGTWVAPEARRSGAGEALLRAAIAHARSMDGVDWLQLAVGNDVAPSARRLYERLGFVEWGAEPDALRHESRSVVEHHMALRLS